MIRIAITPEAELPREAEMIEAILDAGWDYVHLRHPQASERDMRRLIEALPQSRRRQLKLHSHFNLAEEYGLGGVHLNSRNPAAPEGYSGLISYSCHSIEEATEAKGCEYVTLSPIFDSISKQGYTAAFSHEQLLAIPAGRVIALGGVTAEQIDAVKCYPFAGFAMLGYLFNSRDISELKDKLETINSKI